MSVTLKYILMSLPIFFVCCAALGLMFYVIIMSERKKLSVSNVAHFELKGTRFAFNFIQNAKIILLVLFVVSLGLSLFPASNERSSILFDLLAVYFGIFTVGMFVLDKIFLIKWKTYRDTGSGKVGSDAPNFSGYVVLIIFTLITLAPFYIVFLISIMNSGEANGIFKWWPENGFNLDGYISVFRNDTYFITIFEALGNTMLYTIAPTLICIFISALSAYGFAKLELRGKNVMFSFLLFTIMMPSCITMSSSYLMYDTLYLTDTPWPFILPSLFGSVSTVFFMREYFVGVPNEIIESAKLDGAHKMLVFFKIMLPLCWPAVLSQIILVFISRYNDYLGPLLYLTDPTKYTLQLFLRQYCDGNVTSDKQVLCAASILVMLPLIIIYLFLQKQILFGISVSAGLKG